MRYLVTVSKKDGPVEIYEADGYSTNGCVLQLFTHTPIPNAKIKIFPLTELTEINLEDKSA